MYIGYLVPKLSSYKNSYKIKLEQNNMLSFVIQIMVCYITKKEQKAGIENNRNI